MRRLFVLLAALVSLPALGATYTYIGPLFTSHTDHTTCTLGTCADYTTSMHVTGSFSTAAPLARNLVISDITALITAYSFNDGINTIASGNPNARILSFQVTTNGTGAIIGWSIMIDQWTSGTAGAHVPGDRLNRIFAGDFSNDVGWNNASCGSLGSGDSCNGLGPTSDTSFGQGPVATGIWFSQLGIGIPTLSAWGMIILSALVILSGLLFTVRRSRVG